MCVDSHHPLGKRSPRLVAQPGSALAIVDRWAVGHWLDDLSLMYTLIVSNARFVSLHLPSSPTAPSAFPPSMCQAKILPCPRRLTAVPGVGSCLGTPTPYHTHDPMTLLQAPSLPLLRLGPFPCAL